MKKMVIVFFVIASFWGKYIQAQESGMIPGHSSEIEIGGLGSENGKFEELIDMSIGPNDYIYALEPGRYWEGNKWIRINPRVQIFDNSGKFLRSFYSGDYDDDTIHLIKYKYHSVDKFTYLFSIKSSGIFQSSDIAYIYFCGTCFEINKNNNEQVVE